MAKGMPSMTALLALLAVAGYQNRSKISEMLRNSGMGSGNAATGLDTRNGSAVQNILSEIGSFFSGASGGSALSGGLSGIVDHFQGKGQGATAQSWVSRDANLPMSASDVADTLGEETMAELVAKTGLSREEVAARLSKALPEAVNHMTPEGRLPTAEDAQAFI
ncbi:MAG: YidB family protein [Cypionkella sp.]